MKKTYCLWLSLLCFSACVREANFDADQKVPDTIVVSGDFTNSAGIHRLFLTRPNAYGNSRFTPIKDAQVWVVADNGDRAAYLPKEKTLVIDPDFCYELPAGALPGVPGRSYFLEIKLADGRLYRSVPTQMPSPLAADSLHNNGVIQTPSPSSDQQLKFITTDVYTTIPDDGRPYYLRWDIFRVFHFQEFYRDPTPPKTQTYCFVHDFFDQQRVHLQAFENDGGASFHQQLAQLPLDPTFEVLNYFTVMQHTLPKEAYLYWKQIDRAANPDGTVFDPPPSPVRGNVYNVNDAEEIPLGYFEVAGVDTVRTKLVTTHLGSEFAAPRYCQFKPPTYAHPGPECECCLVLPLSLYQKPWYWME